MAGRLTEGGEGLKLRRRAAAASEGPSAYQGVSDGKLNYFRRLAFVCCSHQVESGFGVIAVVRSVIESMHSSRLPRKLHSTLSTVAQCCHVVV